MSNENLKRALAQTGITADQIADHAGVDVKTVYRWLNGITPYPRHRKRVSELLDVPIGELWPDIAPKPEPKPATNQEPAPGRQLVEMFASSTAPGAPDPVDLIEHATGRIWLLDLTHADLITDEIATLLATKARAGCEVRVLISHPESIYLTTEQAERQPDIEILDEPEAVEHIHTVMQRLSQISEAGGETRTFVAPGYSTITIADQQLLISPHVYATPTKDAPGLRLDAEAQPDLFAVWQGHFQLVWTAAEPVEFM